MREANPVRGEGRESPNNPPQRAIQQNFYQYFNKISAKHIDFIICDKNNLNVLMCLELNDSSHEKAHRKQRDVFLKNVFHAAKIPLVWFPAKAVYKLDDVDEILSRELIRLSNEVARKRS